MMVNGARCVTAETITTGLVARKLQLYADSWDTHHRKIQSIIIIIIIILFTSRSVRYMYTCSIVNNIYMLYEKRV